MMCFFRFAYIRLERMERIVFAYLYISICVCARYINHSEDGVPCDIPYIANPMQFLRDITQQNSCMRGSQGTRGVIQSRGISITKYACVCACVCTCVDARIYQLYFFQENVRTYTNARNVVRISKRKPHLSANELRLIVSVMQTVCIIYRLI